MSDLDERPLPEQTRLRLRAELHAIASSDQSTPDRTWPTVMAAVAAVLAVVVAASGAALLRGGQQHTSAGYIPPPAPNVTVPHRPGASTRPMAWTAVRTDRDPALLVVTYMGGDGSCEGAVDTRVHERAKAVIIDLRAEVPAPRTVVQPDGRRAVGLCDLVGVDAQVEVRLSLPLGTRAVIDPNGRSSTGGAVQVRHRVFDGSRLLTPTGLPRGYVRERDHEYLGTAGWTRSWSDTRGPNLVTPEPAASAPTVQPQATCNPQRHPTVLVRQGGSGPTSIPPSWSPAGTVTIAQQPAQLRKDSLGNWSLFWHDPTAQQNVEVQSFSFCSGMRPFNEQEFLTIARSLRPA
ncbi:hypothetical protein CLV35_2633 [Motilibacter peucedani]|uniref:Uncharacterized protein n=1 Tax=Motilibacter peucedani TaxID=598650 RepID=A0A420XPJ4_9ACTN|nr:hypothetical protein [Motilibacter peucedani]RKS74131.1 hypothetical protein CLV35_2633 [Motilibacter peucedani]